MELANLRYFYEVAKHQGFSRAARRLRAQQPTLSRAVRMLEEELGERLFVRSTRSVALTAAGQRLFLECQKLLELVENIPSIVKTGESELQGYLQFAISDSTLQNILPPVLHEFARLHPKVVVSVATGTAPQLFQKIASGDLEFGLLFTGTKRWGELAATKICEVPFCVVVAEDKHKDRDVLESYVAAREVEDGRDQSGEELAHLKAVAPHGRVRYSANSYVMHKEIVMRGMGISMFPRFFVEKEIKAGKLKVLNPRKPLMAEFNLITREGFSLSDRAQALLKTMQPRFDLMRI
jgi:DNA-binding transcriptional LysR family regulator